MPTKKKTPTARKTARKAAPKRTAAKKTAPKKTAPKKSKTPPSKAAAAREAAAAQTALKLVDEAAALLRKGIRVSATTTEKSRHEAKKKAHALLNRASSTLGGLLNSTTAALDSLIKKI